MSSFAVSFKAFFGGATKPNLLGDVEKSAPIQSNHLEEPPRQKLTKELLLNSLKDGGGLKLQRRNSDKFDEYYEMASLQMFY